MAFAYQHQPLKALFKSWQYTIAIPFYHLPSWVLSAIPMLWEKKKGSWNLLRHIITGLARQFVYIEYKTGLADFDKMLSLPDESDEPGRVWIKPVPDNFIVGDVRRRAESLHITSVPVLGYWIHRSKDIPVEERPYPGEKVLLCIHGGGYVTLTAHSKGPASGLPKGLLERCPSIRRAISIEYRLSTGPPLPSTNQFPTALLDVLAGYIYLVEMGFKEKDIIIVGDSAGGNAGVALARYLVEGGRTVKVTNHSFPSPPGSLLLLSPSQVKFAQYDFLGTLNKWFPLYCATSFVGARPEDRVEAFYNPYISPASPEVLGLIPGSSRIVSFKGFPRTWIEVGGFETLLDQVRRLRDAMIEDMGEEMVEYHEVDGAVHDHLSLTYHEPDRTESFNLVSAWLERVNVEGV